jgi:hypothetical protein
VVLAAAAVEGDLADADGLRLSAIARPTCWAAAMLPPFLNSPRTSAAVLATDASVRPAMSSMIWA